jgi:cystathionine beta-lyase/cystathionine gamma-synthase
VATIPAISTHAQQGEVGRTLAGIPGNLIRLAVGGEHPDDVIADLDQALAAIAAPSPRRAEPTGFSVGGASSRRT